MQKISVVIPVYRDDVELQGLLSALASLSIAEIIIVDGEQRPAPLHLINSAHGINVQWRNAPQGRGAQIAAGIKAATQPIIWILHADCRPTAACQMEITTHLAKPETSLTCFPLTFRSQELALKLFEILSRFDSGLSTFGDQGFAFRRVDYKKLNLDLSEFPLLEDVALRSALLRFGNVRKSHIPLFTSARRFERLGVWRTQLRNFMILLNYWRGISPAALHAQYYQLTSQTTPRSQQSWPVRPVSRLAQVAGQKTGNDYRAEAASYP